MSRRDGYSEQHAAPAVPEFEANLRKGREKLPRKVEGFTFTTLPVAAAQTYRERGRKGKTTIRFDDVVPNG